MKTMKFCAIAALAAIYTPTFAAIRPPSGASTTGKGIRPNAGASSKRETFVLKDTSRTGAWVVAMPVLDGFVADGKAFWVSEPSCPFHWWLSLTSRDGLYKAFLNDNRYYVKWCEGSLENAPEFSTAEGFAELLLSDVASTYKLSKVQVYHASYTPYRPTDPKELRFDRETSKELRYYEFKAIFTGERENGQVASVMYLTSVKLSIMALTDKFCSFMTQMPRSCLYPPGDAKRAMALMKHMLGTLTPNLEFAQYVNQCSTQQTRQWVRSQNEQQEQFQKVMSDRQDAYDRSFEAWRNVIKETETVSAGGNEAYEVPWGADNSYVDENGGFVQKSNDEFLEESRRSGRTVDQEKQNYESEHRTLRKLAPLKKPGNL